MKSWRLIRQTIEMDTPVLKERASSSFLIGRDRTSSIKCRSTYVSRKHCIIEFGEDENWTLRDMGSLNGTYLNSIRLKEEDKRELRENDIIGIGIGGEVIEDELIHPNLYVFKWSKAQEIAPLVNIVTGNGTVRKRKVLRRKRKRTDNNGSSKNKKTKLDKNGHSANNSSTSDSDDNDEDNSILKNCHICLEKFKIIKKLGREFHSTPCGHVFCKNCIINSLTISPNCPVCRTAVKSSQTHRIFL